MIKRAKKFLKWPTQELPWKFQYIPGNSSVFFFFSKGRLADLD